MAVSEGSTVTPGLGLAITFVIEGVSVSIAAIVAALDAADKSGVTVSCTAGTTEETLSPVEEVCGNKPTFWQAPENKSSKIGIYLKLLCII